MVNEVSKMGRNLPYPGDPHGRSDGVTFAQTRVDEVNQNQAIVYDHAAEGEKAQPRQYVKGDILIPKHAKNPIHDGMSQNRPDQTKRYDRHHNQGLDIAAEGNGQQNV